MKRTILLLVFPLLLLIGCESPTGSDSVPKAEPTVFVYGTTSCGLTTQCRNNLTAANIPFEFKNLTEGENGTELWSKLNESDVNNNGQIPVVDVNGTLLVRPSLEQIKEQL